MAIDRRAIGRDAEERAVAHLQSSGLRILCRNYRCRLGEIDVVALERRQVLVLVEVRLRNRRDFGGAAASVDRPKQRRLIRAARHLLMKQPKLARLPARFDVIELEFRDDGPCLAWHRAAFET